MSTDDPKKEEKIKKESKEQQEQKKQSDITPGEKASVKPSAENQDDEKPSSGQLLGNWLLKTFNKYEYPRRGHGDVGYLHFCSRCLKYSQLTTSPKGERESWLGYLLNDVVTQDAASGDKILEAAKDIYRYDKLDIKDRLRVEKILLTLAAEKNHPEAMFILACRHLKSNYQKEAVKWLISAAKMGYRSPNIRGEEILKKYGIDYPAMITDLKRVNRSGLTEGPPGGIPINTEAEIEKGILDSIKSTTTTVASSSTTTSSSTTAAPSSNTTSSSQSESESPLPSEPPPKKNTPRGG